MNENEHSEGLPGLVCGRRFLVDGTRCPMERSRRQYLPRPLEGETCCLFLILCDPQTASCRFFVPAVTRHKLHPSAFQTKFALSHAQFREPALADVTKVADTSRRFVTTLPADQVLAPPSENALFMPPSKQAEGPSRHQDFVLFCFVFLIVFLYAGSCSSQFHDAPTLKTDLLLVTGATF